MVDAEVVEGDFNMVEEIEDTDERPPFDGGLVRSERKTLVSPPRSPLRGMGYVEQAGAMPGWTADPIGQAALGMSGNAVPGVILSNNTSQAVYSSASDLLAK